MGFVSRANCTSGGARLQRWLGLGALLALFWGARANLWRAADPRAAQVGAGWHEARSWVCDRDGGALVGFTRDAWPCARVALLYPLEVQPGGAGRLWLLHGTQRGPQAPRRLVSLVPGGERRLDLCADGLRSLVAWGQGGVAGLVDDSPTARVVGWGALGASFDLGQLGRDVLLAGAPGGNLWAIDSRGLWCSLERSSPLGRVREFAGARAFAAFAWGPRGGWALEGLADGTQVLVRLEANGRERTLSSLALPKSSSGSFLLAAAVGGGLWICSEGGEVLRLDASSRPRLRTAFASLGIEAIVASADGCLSAVTPGALMRLDFHGNPLPGQGSLRYATALAVFDP